MSGYKKTSHFVQRLRRSKLGKVERRCDQRRRHGSWMACDASCDSIFYNIPICWITRPYFTSNAFSKRVHFIYLQFLNARSQSISKYITVYNHNVRGKILLQNK